jgi:hypothetical protein
MLSLGLGKIFHPNFLPAFFTRILFIPIQINWSRNSPKLPEILGASDLRVSNYFLQAIDNCRGNPLKIITIKKELTLMSHK